MANKNMESYSTTLIIREPNSKLRDTISHPLGCLLSKNTQEKNIVENVKKLKSLSKAGGKVKQYSYHHWCSNGIATREKGMARLQKDKNEITK